jgi:hypothetical protein
MVCCGAGLARVNLELAAALALRARLEAAVLRQEQWDALCYNRAKRSMRRGEAGP